MSDGMAVRTVVMALCRPCLRLIRLSTKEIFLLSSSVAESEALSP